MRTDVKEKIKVVAAFDPDSWKLEPRRFIWHRRTFEVTKVDFFHRTRDGRHLIDIYDCSTDSNPSFRLKYLTFSREWILWRTDDGMST